MCFFFNDTATTEIYTLSLHDALPICAARVAAVDGGVGLDEVLEAPVREAGRAPLGRDDAGGHRLADAERVADGRSEEHTSELQSRQYLVCRLLLEKNHKVSIGHLQAP